MMTKIGAIVQSALNVIHNQDNVILHLYTGQNIDDAGLNTPTYVQINSKARIQPISQDLVKMWNLEAGKTYKSFYLLTEYLTTVNRNIGTGGDYIEWNSLFYRIVKVPEVFYTDWQHVVGIQTTGMQN